MLKLLTVVYGTQPICGEVEDSAAREGSLMAGTAVAGTVQLGSVYGVTTTSAAPYAACSSNTKAPSSRRWSEEEIMAGTSSKQKRQRTTRATKERSVESRQSKCHCDVAVVCDGCVT